jgi:hypothetical protein
MSSLKQLNRSITLKRLEGKDNARQCALTLNLLLFTVRKHTKSHPFVVTLGVSLSTFILAKYKNKIRTIYPFFSLGFNYFK